MGRLANDLDRSEEDRLVLPLDFEMERADRVMRRFLIGLTALIVFTLAVLAIAPMREVAIASGEIRPAADLIEIAHPEGGVIEALLAERGDLLRPGDPILRLRPLDARTDLERLSIRRESLALQRERLDALLSDRAPVWPIGHRLGPDARRNARASYDLERAALERRLSALEAQRTQRVAEIAAKTAELEEIAAEMSAYAEQFQARQELADRGLARRSEALSLSAQLAEARSRHAMAQGQLESARAAIVQIDAQIEEAAATQRASWSRERGEVAAQLSELDRQLAQLADRLERRTVRASAYGVLHELHVTAPGAVARPNAPIATLVPVEGEVFAEVRISPDDIGHIQTGDAAVVRISTFDPELVGEISGVVRRLSPTAFLNEQGQPYFKAELSLDRTAVDVAGARQTLSPGMVVQAQIRTGEKSVLRYLFKPVARALDRAFSER